jgi:F0F1-type ATP synthase membrane subunit c/vacuolar-type H+-ATPase subunit K
LPAALSSAPVLASETSSATIFRELCAIRQFTNLLIGFALAEATGLFGLLIALIILFG